MSDILGTFKQKAEDLLGSIDRAGGLRPTLASLRRQMAEADRRRALARARSELRRLDAQISEMVAAVGVQAVGLHKAGKLAAPELAPLCAHIVELEAALAQQRVELARLEAATTGGPPASTAEGRSCGACGRALPDDATFCPYCGRPAPATTGASGAPVEAFCAGCGAPLRPGARFCSRCGRGART